MINDGAELPNRVRLVASRDKIATLRDKMLHVDTGDPMLDREFPAFLRVITAPGQQAVTRVGRGSG